MQPVLERLEQRNGRVSRAETEAGEEREGKKN